MLLMKTDVSVHSFSIHLFHRKQRKTLTYTHGRTSLCGTWRHRDAVDGPQHRDQDQRPKRLLHVFSWGFSLASLLLLFCFHKSCFLFPPVAEQQLQQYHQSSPVRVRIRIRIRSRGTRSGRAFSCSSVLLFSLSLCWCFPDVCVGGMCPLRTSLLSSVESLEDLRQNRCRGQFWTGLTQLCWW